MKLKIALAQIALELGEPEKNFSTAEAAVEKAAKQGAGLVLLPELWASGYDLENTQRHASSLSEGWFSRMGELADKHQIALGGSLIEVEGDQYYNTFLLVDGCGKQLGHYRKVHLFDLIQEKDYLSPGTQLALIDSPWGKVGLALCYDLRFPELFRALAVKGAEIILLVAEWPRRRIAHWDALLLARAIENQCFVAAVNKVGSSKGEQLGGNSAVINPMGKILVQGDGSPDLLVAEIDTEESTTARGWMPVLTDRKPDLYG